MHTPNCILQCTKYFNSQKFTQLEETLLDLELPNFSTPKKLELKLVGIILSRSGVPSVTYKWLAVAR